MRAFGLAFAGILAVIVPVAAHANGPGSNTGAIGGNPAGHVHQWNGGSVPPHWAPNRSYGAWAPYCRPAVPNYWVWGPSGGAFDYPDLLGELP